MSRIKVDRITDKAGTGAPILVNGMNVTGKSTMGDIVGAAVTFNSITGGSANFSSDVSIGGTLTYEDVTNIDSVGLITARTGIKVTDGGVDVTAGGIDVSAGGIKVIAGGIGIGTVTPANLLDIHGANGAGGLRLTETNHTNLNRHGRIFEYAGGLYFQSRNDTVNGDFIFRGGQDGVEKLRIGSSSQIGIAGANYGTSGQVLTSGGPSAAPQWASPAGAFVKLASGSATDGQFITVTENLFTSTYFQYKILFSCTTTSGNPTRLGINFTKDNGTTWPAGNSSDYRYSSDGRIGGSSMNNNASGQNAMNFLGGDAYEQWEGEITITNPSSTATIKNVNFVGTVMAGTSSYYGGTVISNVTYRPGSNQLAAVTGIRFERNNSGGLSLFNWSLIAAAV